MIDQSAGVGRDLRLLPKAHLHLHFTGSMKVATLVELAETGGIELPESLTDQTALNVPADRRGWFRFQRAYDMARRVVRSEAAMRTVVRQAAIDDLAEGSRRLELQIDPTSYAPWVDGIINALEIVLDEAKTVSAELGIQVAIIVAGSRIRHPLEARTLARLAARHAGSGPGEVVAFGLSNDEWVGNTPEFASAFRIARAAGLPGVPHGGELRGPSHVRAVVDALAPARLGHGVRAAEDPALLDDLVERGIAFEVCPTSNVHLGVYSNLEAVPLPAMVAAGAIVALGADDPLLFHSRLVDQYRAAREVFGFNDAAIARLAAGSVRASFASDADKSRWLGEIRVWLASPVAPAPLIETPQRH